MQKDLVINAEFINTLYKVIAKIVKMRTKDSFLIPDMPQADPEGKEPTDEERNASHKRIEESMRVNQEVERFNEEVTKMQAKIKI